MASTSALSALSRSWTTSRWESQRHPYERQTGEWRADQVGGDATTTTRATVLKVIAAMGLP